MKFRFRELGKMDAKSDWKFGRGTVTKDGLFGMPATLSREPYIDPRYRVSPLRSSEKHKGGQGGVDQVERRRGTVYHDSALATVYML